jgi:hypothetical protein
VTETEGQTTIEMYCKVIDEFGQLAKTNGMLSAQLLPLCDRYRCLQTILKNSPIIEEAGPLLKRILEQSFSQSKTKVKGYRYMNEALNNFCLNTYILGRRRMSKFFMLILKEFSFLQGRWVTNLPNFKLLFQKVGSYLKILFLPIIK